MSKFDTYLGAVLDHGAGAAQGEGSATIEAHHLLLGIAAEGEASTERPLTAAGLDVETIRAALDREYQHSLAAAGVSAAAFDLPEPSAPPEPTAKLGTSARLALERMAASSSRKDMRPAHLLLGILQAEVGTVPRALALAGVDRGDLLTRVRQALETHA